MFIQEMLNAFSHWSKPIFLFLKLGESITPVNCHPLFDSFYCATSFQRERETIPDLQFMSLSLWLLARLPCSPVDSPRWKGPGPCIPFPVSLAAAVIAVLQHICSEPASLACLPYRRKGERQETWDACFLFSFPIPGTWEVAFQYLSQRGKLKRE